MRSGRLLSMLIILQLKGRVTAQALAEEFEVSVRTVYRDADALSAAGVPIYAERGPGGGFRLLDGYRTQLTGLTPGEAEALLLAGLPGPAAELGLGEHAAAARLKLLAALPPAIGAEAARVAERFHLDPLDWFRRSAPPEHLPVVARAVWEGRRLSVRYRSWEKTSDRVLDPLGLVLKGGVWYLVAARGGEARTYRISSILETEALDEPCERPDDFDLAAHWAREAKRFAASLRKGTARIRVSKQVMGRIDALGADIAEAMLAAEEGEDGWREAEVPIESVNFAAIQLMGFADRIEVRDPPELRARLLEQAERIVALYATS